MIQKTVMQSQVPTGIRRMRKELLQIPVTKKTTQYHQRACLSTPRDLNTLIVQTRESLTDAKKSKGLKHLHSLPFV